jgi:hypothetical protein
LPLKKLPLPKLKKLKKQKNNFCSFKENIHEPEQNSGSFLSKND